MRLKHGDHYGPARELHAGSGYLSQDSAVQVLGLQDGPTKIWIRWAGGKVTESAIPPGARSLAVGLDGGVHVLE